MSAIDEFVVGQVYERLCAGGPDPFFAPEKRGNAPAYLRSCGELLEASPNSTMRQRARTLDDFIQVWESVELEASTESFLRIGFAILRGERHATLIRRFLIHELLLPLLEVEELATPSADVFPETSVDAWWQDCASLIAWADPQRCFSEASWAALDAVLSRVCRAGGLSEPQCAMLRSYKRLLERLAGCVESTTPLQTDVFVVASLRAICFAPGLEWTDPASRARLVELAADLFPDHADELSLLKEVIARSEPAGWVEILYGACSAGPDRPTAIVAPYVFGLLRKAISAATLDEAEVRSLLATCAKVYRPDRQDPVLHDLLSATGVSADERVRRIGRLAGALVPSDTPARRAIEAFSKYCLCQPATYGAEFVRLSVMVLHSITWKEPGARHAIRRDVQWLFEQDTLNCPGPLPAKAPGNLEIVRATLRALE